MYDPKIGRWISEDPIGFQAADANLYRYVRNSPSNLTDPNGLEISGPRYNPYATPFVQLTEEKARAVLEGQIKEWEDKGWELPAHLLRRFLDNTGTDYVPTQDDTIEVSKQSEAMIKLVLTSLVKDRIGNGRDPLPVGTALSYEGMVRWVLPSSPIGLVDRIRADERFVSSNAFMFYSYGGAKLKLDGKVKAFCRKVYRDTITVKAKITLSDDYEFKEEGPLGVRLAFAAYQAANYLQLKAGYKTFSHKLTFDKEYDIFVGDPPPRVTRPGPK